MNNRLLIGTVSLENRCFTRAFLFSAFRGDWGDADWLVIDNGSQQDDILSLKVEFPEVNFIRNEEHRGVAPAWNQILKYGDYDYYCIANNDVFLSKRFVPLMIEFMDTHLEFGCCSPYCQDCRLDLAKTVSDRYDQVRGFYTNESQILSALYLTYKQWNPLTQDLLRGFDNYASQIEEEYKEQVLPQILGSCFVIRKEVLHDIGYLDEEFTDKNVGVSEDFTYSAKLRTFQQEKWKQMMAKNIVLHHFGCQTRKRDDLMMQYYGISGDQWEAQRHKNTEKFWGSDLKPQSRS